jgi:hypothetical protein
MKMEGASPARLLEMLSDRFGAFEAIANSSIKLARVAPEEELAMEPLLAASSVYACPLRYTTPYKPRSFTYSRSLASRYC